MTSGAVVAQLLSTGAYRVAAVKPHLKTVVRPPTLTTNVGWCS